MKLQLDESAKMLEQMPVGPHELSYPGLIERLNELPRSGSTQQWKAQPNQSMVVSRDNFSADERRRAT
eukprot:m.68082 g.68082  ORF g.68082 m.68082 type:complete len:68 (+) comp18282_c1_seq1:159-362(+)